MLGIIIIILYFQFLKNKHYFIIVTHMQVAIYQITDTGLCQQLQSLYNNGVNVSLLVSATIVSNDDWRAAQQCYCQLYQHGLKGNIRKALNKFRFAHQKYWITDNSAVHLSTGRHTHTHTHTHSAVHRHTHCLLRHRSCCAHYRLIISPQIKLSCLALTDCPPPPPTHTNSTGNWSPSDFPNGTVFHPHAQQNVNRDLLVTMEGPDIVTAFQTVFNNDWATGSDWEPKYCN